MNNSTEGLATHNVKQLILHTVSQFISIIMHRVAKKRDTKLMALTLLILNRFSKISHQILQ